MPKCFRRSDLGVIALGLKILNLYWTVIRYVFLYCVALLHCFGFCAIGNIGLIFSKKTLLFLKEKFAPKGRLRAHKWKAHGKIGGWPKRERMCRSTFSFAYGR